MWGNPFLPWSIHSCKLGPRIVQEKAGKAEKGFLYLEVTAALQQKFQCCICKEPLAMVLDYMFCFFCVLLMV